LDNIFIMATERSPEVDFNFCDRRLALRGEAYPEDAASFFGPLLRGLSTYCETIKGQALMVEIQLCYFNTSSAKAVMNIIQILENAARCGTKVNLNWFFQKEDEVIREFGEDFSGDLEHVRFQLVEM